MMEPKFPLPTAPACRICGQPCIRQVAIAQNRSGFAGRPYYTCLNGRHSRKFSCWDDTQGIARGNPRCRCGSTSRRTTTTGNDFFSCPVGKCRYFENAPPAYEETEVIVDRAKWFRFSDFMRALFQAFLLSCLTTAEDLGIYERQLCRGFIRLKWVCICGHIFFQDYPESHLLQVQRLQLMLMQSGYQATVLARRRQEGATDLLPTFHASQISASRGNMVGGMQTSGDQASSSGNDCDTANTVPSSNVQDRLQEIIQESNPRADTAEESSSFGSSEASPATVRHTLDEESKDQWLLLCFYHDKYVSSAVHLEVGEEACDVKLISLFQREYCARRGMFRYYVSWRKVTNISFVRFRLIENPKIVLNGHTDDDGFVYEGEAVEEEGETDEAEKSKKEDDIDLALLEDDWAPPEGWYDKNNWEPCPVDPRPKLEKWIMHLWEHPHSSPTYLAFKSMHIRLLSMIRINAGRLRMLEAISSKYCKFRAIKLFECFASKLQHLCARFKYFCGLANPSGAMPDIEQQDVIVEIPHLQHKQVELGRRRYKNTKKGRFFIVNTPKKLNTKLRADSDEPPYGWGLYFEEDTVVPTFVKIFIFTLVISLALTIAVICFKLAREEGYVVFGMGSFTVALASIIFTVILKFLG